MNMTQTSDELEHMQNTRGFAVQIAEKALSDYQSATTGLEAAQEKGQAIIELATKINDWCLFPEPAKVEDLRKARFAYEQTVADAEYNQQAKVALEMEPASNAVTQ